MKIGILIPVCSRNQPWTSYEECFLAKALLPSFEATRSQNYEYRFYIGIDDDDSFFLRHRHRMPGETIIVSNCSHAPARVWNVLCKKAYDDGCEYMFQLADDIILETSGWTERYIEKLQSNCNLGVVGPCHLENYEGRKSRGQPFVLENAFVHRRHYDIFKTFYPHEIKNWYCDDWITRVYDTTLSHMFPDIFVRNLSIHVTEQRYTIESVDIARMVEEGRRSIRQSVCGLFSFCLYGPYSDKYHRGLRENVDLIHTHYPNWQIMVYTAPDSVEFVRAIPGVYCIETGRSGPVNMTYRFLATINTCYDLVCVRDADSRIHERDRWCIDTFITSPYSIYTIRDHSYHRYRIMGGLWGAKRGVRVNQYDLNDYCDCGEAGYTFDTQFLEKHLKTENMVVYSYTPDGLFNDPNEKVCVIDCPMPNGDFCGNVVLFREDGSSYNEFSQT